MGIAVVIGRSNDDPSLLVGDGHASGADIEPNPSCGVNIHHGCRYGVAIIHARLHTGSTPCSACCGAVPGGRGSAPVGIGDGVDSERNRCCSLRRSPRFNVHSERSRMHLLILCKRHLTSVQGHIDAAFVTVEGATEGSRTDGLLTGKIGVRIFAVDGRVLHVGVAKGGDFTAGLEAVRVGVIVVEGVVGVADGETPARRGGAWDGLIHALNPPGEELPLGQVVRESESGVGDFRIFPRAEFVHTALVCDGDNVPRCTAQRRPC